MGNRHPNTTEASAFDITGGEWIDPHIGFISRAPYQTPDDNVREWLNPLTPSVSAAALARHVNSQPPAWRKAFKGMLND